MDEPRTRNLRVTHVVGERFGALFGTYFERDDQGRLIHEMNNGYPSPKINTSRKILGFGVAPQQLGIGASFRYKDFNAAFLVEVNQVDKYSLEQMHYYMVLVYIRILYQLEDVNQVLCLTV